MTKFNVVPIVFSFDSNYVDILKVAGASLLLSKKPETRYKLYLLCDVATQKFHASIKEFFHRIDETASVQFVVLSDQFRNGYEVRNITKQTYYRLLLHKIISESKVIYSDLDVLFMGDLSDLYALDLKDNCLAAVRSSHNLDSEWTKHANTLTYWDSLKQGEYIQAGFLVMNLDAIRALNIPDETYIQMASDRYMYLDQDIINILYQRKMVFLPLKYNLIAYYDEQYIQKLVDSKWFSEQEVKEALEYPVLIHWAGAKPWQHIKIMRAKLWWTFLKSDKRLWGLWIQQRIKYKYAKFVKKRKDTAIIKNIKEKLKIVICCHKPAYLPHDHFYVPLHVGRACSNLNAKDLNWMKHHMQGDDIGENISNLNPYFSEMTGVYWAWKNYDKLGNPEYIGFCHYRRFFDNSLFLKAGKSDVVAVYDICDGESIASQFRLHHSDALDKISQQIIQDDPSYQEIIQKYMNGKAGYFYNMFVMKKEIFFAYCQWIFPLLFKIHENFDYQNVPNKKYNIRMPGFCAERLTGFFIEKIKKMYTVDNVSMVFVNNTEKKYQKILHIGALTLLGKCKMGSKRTIYILGIPVLSYRKGRK